MSDLAIAVMVAILGGYSFYAFSMNDETQIILLTAGCAALLYLLQVALVLIG